MTNAERLCGSCDCSDPTALDGIAADCSCGCHGRRAPAPRKVKAPTAGPFPLRMDAGRTPDMYVVVTNQGNHFATTYDPTAARLIVAAPELLKTARAALALLDQDTPEWLALRAAIHEAR